MTNIFGTTYPIVCAAMNRLSDANLAIAVHQAGCFPFLLYNTPNEIRKFVLKTGSNRFGVFIRRSDFIENKKFWDELIDIKPFAIECINFVETSYARLIRKNGTKLIARVVSLDPYSLENSDILYLKGIESAGTIGHLTTEQLLNEYKVITNKPLIVSGSIDSKEKISYYMNQGVDAVVIGSLFAASNESKILSDVKKKLIESNIKNLNHTTYLGKKTLVIGNFIPDLNDSLGHIGLEKGIAGKDGHIFFSETLNNINEIRTVKEIVQSLTN